MRGQQDARCFGGRGMGPRFDSRGAPGFQRGRGFPDNMRRPGPESSGCVPPRGFFRGLRPPNTGPAPVNVLWAETRLPNGKSYFYHTITRETIWERPEGPNVTIISHDEWNSIKNKGNVAVEDLGNVKSTAEDNSHQEKEGLPNIKIDHTPMQPGQVVVNAPFPWNASPDRFMMEQQFNCRITAPKMLRPPPAPFQDNLAPPFHPSGQFRPPGPGILPGESINSPFKPGIKQGPSTVNVPIPPVVHGYPPCPPMMLMPPQIGIPPRITPHFNVPPPWNEAAGAPIPIGVPPPNSGNVNPVFSQMDPNMVSQVNEWSEHNTPEGKSYFYNAKMQISVWEKPQILKEFDVAAREIVQQRENIRLLKKDTIDKVEQSNQIAKNKIKEKEDRKVEEAKKNKAREMCKPTSCTPISGTPWCIVWTGDKRVFFYNPSTRKSLWERPLELIGRGDIDEMMKTVPDGKSSKVKKAEATSTTGPVSVSDAKIKIAPIKSIKEAKEKPGKKSEEYTESKQQNASKRSEDFAGTEEPKTKRVKNSKTVENETGTNTEGSKIVGHLAENNQLSDLTSCDLSKDEGTSAKTDDKSTNIETKDALKDANALEAELNAARERARIPLEQRLEQFREMLAEKNVSAFSAWEKELHKIVFDPRYLLLASKERRIAFQNYVKTRAEDEKMETVLKIKRIKDLFMKFLGQINVSQRMTYCEFSQKHSRHEMYKIVENSRDRETYYYEYVSELKRNEKIEKAQKKEKATTEFLDVLKTDVKDYHLTWSDVRKKFSSSKYDVITEDEQQKLFQDFQDELKYKVRLAQKKQKEKEEKCRKENESGEVESKVYAVEESKKKKEDKKPASYDKTSKNIPVEEKNVLGCDSNRAENIPVVSNLDNEKDALDFISGNKDKVESTKDKSKPQKQFGEQGLGKMEDISEEEEGCLGDSDDESRRKKERKERAEYSLRKREKEVKETLAGHFRERESERSRHRHGGAVREFQALLNDLVRNADASWSYAKKDIRNDRRWNSVCVLHKREMKELFAQHCDDLLLKKERRFRELLHDTGVKLTSKWRDVKRKIKDDYRYRKFSTSDQKCQREFEFYLNDMKCAVKTDFWELLKESKMLTYKTKQHIRQNSNALKDIECVLSKDKRYLEMDCMPEERDRLLMEFLDDAERKGPPPPPTASTRTNKWMQLSK